VKTTNVSKFVSPNLTPEKFGIPGLSIWLDGRDPNANSTLPANGSTVTRWTDKSGSNNSVTSQAGTVTYDASTNSIVYGGQAYLAKTAMSSLSNFTVFVVAKQTLDTNGALYSHGAGDQVGFLTNLMGGNYYIGAAGSGWSSGVSPFAVGTTYVYSIVYDSSNTITVFGNGTSRITATKGTVSFTGFYLGARVSPAQYFAGNFSEVLLYSSNLTTTQRQTVEGYLAWKWGQQASLPGAHPYSAAAPMLASGGGVTALGSISIDSNDHLQLSATSNIRLTSPTEYKSILTDVSSSTVLSLTSNTYAGVWRITNTGFNALTLPTLTSNDKGGFWNLVNATSSNLSVTLTGTTDIASPVTIWSGGTYMIRWNGSNYYGTQDTQAPPADYENMMIVNRIGSGENKTYVTFDGVNWTSNSYSSSAKPTWTGSNWISMFARSANGINWRTNTGGGGGSDVYSITGWNGTTAVAYNNNNTAMKYSTDGSNWSNATVGTVFSTPTNATVYDIGWGQGKFIAGLAGRSNATYHYATSTDGITWTAGGLIWSSNSASVNVFRIRYNGTHWIAAGQSQNGTTNLARSIDGVTWSNVGSVTNAVTALEWNGDLWLAGNQGRFQTSPDGITWTSNVPSGFSIGNGIDIAWAGNAWYALGCNAGGTAWAVARSQTGTSNWSIVTTFVDSGNNVQPFLSGRRANVPTPPGPAGAAGAGGGISPISVTETSGTSLTLASSNYRLALRTLWLPTSLLGQLWLCPFLWLLVAVSTPR
jgi:hypothetical protein